MSVTIEPVGGDVSVGDGICSESCSNAFLNNMESKGRSYGTCRYMIDDGYQALARLGCAPGCKDTVAMEAKTPYSSQYNSGLGNTCQGKVGESFWLDAVMICILTKIGIAASHRYADWDADEYDPTCHSRCYPNMGGFSAGTDGIECKYHFNNGWTNSINNVEHDEKSPFAHGEGRSFYDTCGKYEKFGIRELSYGDKVYLGCIECAPGFMPSNSDQRVVGYCNQECPHIAC